MSVVQAGRLGAALNVHFHLLVLDGVDVRDEGGKLVFCALAPPTADEVTEVAVRTAKRLQKVLARHGRLRDGTVALVLEPLDLWSRIAALIPPPPGQIAVQTSYAGPGRSVGTSGRLVQRWDAGMTYITPAGRRARAEVAMSRQVVMIIGLAVFTGCGPRLKDAMATALACPEEIELTPGRYLTASGCGKTMYYVRASDRWVSPLARASFDMSCAEADMTVTPVDTTTVGVEGCGKKAAYVVGSDAQGGKWILNAASEVPPEGKALP